MKPGNRNRATMTTNEKLAADAADTVALLFEFVDALKQCRENAEKSTTGECEQHRHGRTGWKSPRL